MTYNALHNGTGGADRPGCEPALGLQERSCNVRCESAVMDYVVQQLEASFGGGPQDRECGGGGTADSADGGGRAMDFAKALWRAAGGRAAALQAAAVAVAHLARCSGGVLREALGCGAAVVERLQGDVGGEGEPRRARALGCPA